jgi:hypothetical protein
MTWAVTVGLAGLFALFAWSLLGLHVNEPRGPVSAAEAASFASIPIPPEATNIRIAGYSQWIQYEQYVRFEAPVAVCLRHAAAVVPGEPLTPVGQDELKSSRLPVRQDVFLDFSWFDLRNASSVAGAGGGPSQPRVWVDQDRGVFYYRKTD